jgi:hypothetical protein
MPHSIGKFHPFLGIYSQQARNEVLDIFRQIFGKLNIYVDDLSVSSCLPTLDAKGACPPIRCTKLQDSRTEMLYLYFSIRNGSFLNFFQIICIHSIHSMALNLR